MGKLAGIELSKAGIDVLLSSGERYFFKTIEEFLVSPYSNIESAVAIARDLLIIRKWKLPKEAENNIEEAISLNADEIFPYNLEEIEFIYQVIDSNSDIEVIIIAIEKTLIDSIRKIKKLKLIVPSAYIYPVAKTDDFFIIKRKNHSEIVKFQNDRLIDWLVKNDTEEGIEIDTAKLLIEVLKNNYIPKLAFLDKRYIFRKTHLAYVAFVSFIFVLILALSIGNFIYWKYKIANIEQKLKKTEYVVTEYTMLNDKLLSERYIIERLSGGNTLELISLIVETLPRDSWVIDFSLMRNEIKITGETRDTQKLESQFKQRFGKVDLQVRNKTENIYEYTLSIKEGKM